MARRGRSSVHVKKTRRTTVTTVTKTRKRKGQKRCPSCGRYM